MPLAKSFRGAFVLGAVLAASLSATGALAQEELSESHRAAAREAIRALGATDEFDVILPNAAEQLRSVLIQATPNYQQEITETIDEVAIDLAARRADLEREAAAIYARNFTEEQLTAIADFYNSDAGQALIQNGTIVTQELYRAAEIWSNGISRDLAVQTDAALEEELGQQAPSSADAGVDPETGAGVSTPTPELRGIE